MEKQRFLFVSQFDRRGWYEVEKDHNDLPPKTVEVDGKKYDLRHISLGKESMSFYFDAILSDESALKAIALGLHRPQYANPK